MLQDEFIPSIEQEGKPVSTLGNLGTRVPEMMLLCVVTYMVLCFRQRFCYCKTLIPIVSETRKCKLESLVVQRTTANEITY
jgi:ABC-type uncharacterized transport system fused permease/ATPase subunit